MHRLLVAVNENHAGDVVFYPVSQKWSLHIENMRALSAYNLFESAWNTVIALLRLARVGIMLMKSVGDSTVHIREPANTFVIGL